MSERTGEMVETVAKRIARMVPMDGSRWNDGYGHDFPREYGEVEKRVIRGIAAAAIEAMRPDREQIAALLFMIRFPKHSGWLHAGPAETAISYEQADAVLAALPVLGGEK